MKVKKNLSIEDDFLELIEERVKELNLNFTTYIQILVNQDLGRVGLDHPDVGVHRYLKDKSKEHTVKKMDKEEIDPTLYRSAAKEAMAIMDM